LQHTNRNNIKLRMLTIFFMPRQLWKRD